jgi:nucleotide-binding universal stress UspA family protein
MFKKILLPVNLTDKHQWALDVAADLAWQSRGEIVLLHVIEVIHGVSRDEERGFYDRLEKMAREHLKRLGGQLKHSSVRWRWEVLFGNRAAEVVRFAAATEADLIVLTSPRFDPNNPGAAWGSLSYKISFLCQCPVLLVK